MAQEIEGDLFVGEVAQKVVIEHEGKILLSRDVGIDVWDSPGGRLHKEEKPKEGLAREVKEEIGVEIEIGEVFYTDVFLPVNPNKSMRPRFMLCYRGTLKDPSQSFVLAPDEIAEVKWANREEAMATKVWAEYKGMLEAYFAK